MSDDTPLSRPRRRANRARRALLLLAALAVGSEVALSRLIERDPRLRDPEYGCKVTWLSDRIREHPGRPLVLALGSSRVCMGVCPAPRGPGDSPDAVPADDPARPLLFNFGIVGSGPVMELFCLHRLLADGVRPDSLLVEFWPPFLYEEGGQFEERRIDVNRLGRGDVRLLRRYSDDADRLAGRWRQARLLPWSAHRFSLLSMVTPGLLPWYNRHDAAWDGLDPWGWLPAREGPNDPESHRRRMGRTYEFYHPIFEKFCISPVAEQAWRELLGLCRREGISVTLLWMPESGEFRSWYPPAVAAASEDFLGRLRAEYGAGLIDARLWAADPEVPDGFHLSPAGAARFTARLQREVVPGLPLRGRGRP
jgi:hypothetical protein